MTDPWLIQSTTTNSNNEITEEGLKFEDNFIPTTTTNGDDKELVVPLPDSASYLLNLEQKLDKIKKGTKLVDALSSKRQYCLRTLLQEGEESVCNNASLNGSNNNDIFELDAPVNNTESTVLELFRHIQPVQALTLGETVHIVKYDQLEQQEEEQLEEREEEDEDNTLAEETASHKSR